LTEDELIARHVELRPDRPWAGEARLVESAISVWALIGYLRAVDGDHEKLARDYELSQEEVDAAVAYYKRNKCSIDARLAKNEAALS
jgi:uncharacterized protein (DUF433 family)